MSRRIVGFLPLVGVGLSLSGCIMTGGYNAVQSNDATKLHEAMNVPNRDENLVRLMFIAIRKEEVDCVRELLDAPGAAEYFSHQQVANLDYFLAYAQSADSREIVRLLLEHGAKGDGGNIVYKGAKPTKTASAKSTFKGKPVAARVGKGVAVTAAEDDSESEVAATPEVPRLTPLFHMAENPDDYALIVGVEKYTDLPAATYAESDAESAKEFVHALGVPSRNIATLTGARATRSGLAKNLESWLANNVNENSTVYFYYSGHGAPDPRDGQAYLVPIDGDPQYLNQTAYPLKQVYEKLNALKAKRVVVMLDSCFSGAGGRSVLARGARPLVSTVDIGTGASSDKITVLAAAGGDQISGTDEEDGHGLFSYYLFTGLNGAAKDATGGVTVASLYGYLKPKVMDDARRANREQTPQLLCNSAASDAILRGK